MAETVLKLTGISLDPDPYDQSIETWTAGNNVKFDQGNTIKSTGWSETLTNQYNTVPEPYYLQTWSIPLISYWVLACDQRVLLTAGNDDFKDITRTSSDTNPTDCLDSTESSTTVVINDTGHGAITNDWVMLNGYDMSTSGLVSLEVNSWHQITKIDDDSYSIEVLTAASATVSGFGGSVGQIGYLDLYTEQAIRWNGGVLSGVLVLNNMYDVPQYMYINGDHLDDLPNWPADTICKVIKPFKNYLIALNTTESDIEYPYRVRWSHPADPGVVPSTWDEADATKDSGFAEISQSQGAILDGLPLRDIFVVYKEHSTWAMSHVGGRQIFGITQLFDDDGILAMDCACEFNNQHFVVGHDDVYIHDGAQKKSVIEAVMRDHLFTDINPDYYEKTFVVKHQANKEIYICYPDSTSEYCNKACVWNWVENTWTIRDLPDVSHITQGVVDSGAEYSYATSTETYATTSLRYNSRTYNPTAQTLLMAGTVDSKLYVADDTVQHDGDNYNAYVERQGLLFDSPGMKHISRVYPNISGSGQVTIKIGCENIPNAGITYKSYPFTIGSSHKIDTRVSGRYIALRIESENSGNWDVESLRIEIQPDGSR